MYKLTTGDLRSVADAITGWKMYIDPILDHMTSVPEEVQERIRNLEETYRKDFYGFFRDAMEKDSTLLAGRVQRDFEAEWTVKHPDFYDMDLLLSGCGETDLKNAEKQIMEAKEMFR
ncbi:MAG: hypothetical protein IKQ49_10980 [Eubacterium sp.]|nr:hypothetical protein [Eubacterium sp.]MBR6173671.1 hypothetical protein [Eubacterium sp.]